MSEQVDPAMLKRLKEMKERFARGKEEAKKNAGGGTTLPPDSKVKYLTRVSKARLVDTDNGPAMVLEFTCIDGDYTGEKATHFMGMDTDEKVGYMLRDLNRLGYEIDNLDPEDVVGICTDLNASAPVVKIKVVEKGNYINTYIDKVVPLDQGGDLPAAPDETPPAPAPAAPKKPAPAAPAAAKAAAPAPAASKTAAKAPGTASAGSKAAAAKLPPPEAEEPQEAAQDAAAEEAVEEAPEETMAESFTAGSAVSFKTKFGVKTGKVHKVLDDGKTLHVRADENQKLLALDIEKNEVSNLIETPTE